MHYKTIIESIGNTPLVKMNTTLTALMLAKLEYLNPGGSLKDRSALYMIQKAEQEGLLKPGGTIIEGSSGNQGIAAAMIGAYKGYKVIITASQKVSKEKIQTLQAYGAEVILCPPTTHLEDPTSYYSKAVEIHKNTPGSFMLNQYFNLLNGQAHYHLLGPEIWRQTNGEITHLIGATGTGGHVSGAGRYLKEQNPAIKVVAVDSNNSWYSTQGNPKPYKLEGIGIDFDAPNFDKKTIDDVIPVSDDDAIEMLKILSRKHGILVGPSSGAVAYGAFEYAKNLGSDAVVVIVFGDSGRAYLTKNFYHHPEESYEPGRSIASQQLDQNL